MITYLKISAGVVAGALLGVFVGQYTGAREERAKIEAVAAVEAVKRYQEMEKDGSFFKGLDDVHRCKRFAVAVGLSVADCETSD